jgi:hypothetical protein
LPVCALKFSFGVVVGWVGFHSIMWSPQLCIVLKLGCDKNIYLHYIVYLNEIKSIYLSASPP